MEASCDMGSTKSELLAMGGDLGEWLRGSQNVDLSDLPDGDAVWWYVHTEASAELRNMGGEKDLLPRPDEVRTFFQERGMLEEPKERVAERVRAVLDRLRRVVAQSSVEEGASSSMTVVLVGHANFFHEMLQQQMGTEKWMENAEIVECAFV